MEPFEEFFRRATRTSDHPEGFAPHGYQARVARDGLPAVVQAPTGTGKTGVILAWLWRRFHETHRNVTPRRLIYALPQRSLVEQVARDTERWLEKLGLSERVPRHVVMGGEGKTQGPWRLNMHESAIVVGTVDALVSKALLRGYGIGRATYPIDFALVTNGAHWVIDEIQLCRESTTTLRQLAAFAKTFPTAEPFGLTCMSATVPKGLLTTVDNPSLDPGDVLEIEPEERTGELAMRLGAKRTIRKLAIEPGDYEGLAQAAMRQHRPGALTLVVLNTVNAAREVYKKLSGRTVPRMLLHSRFRGTERASLTERLTEELSKSGGIVVATQVVEAGIDLSATVLISEAAPWPSVVQRAGRCNRTGRVPDAELWWIPPGKPQPYEQPDIDATSSELTELEGRAVTSEDLLGRRVTPTETPVSVLRRSDFIELFDTAPDLSGADLDIAPYVRDTDDLDVQLAWATWPPEAESGRAPGDGGAPPPDAKAPPAPDRCRAQLRDLGVFMKREGVIVWRLDQVAGRWTRVTPRARARPGEVLVTFAGFGGYDPEWGFDPAARGTVQPSPELESASDPATGAEDAYRSDSASVAQPAWVPLDTHGQETRDHAIALLDVLRPRLSDDLARTAVVAAYLHDVGKAHPIWQDALCALAAEDERTAIEKERPWAKSREKGALRFKDGVAFRHELASLLLLDGPLLDLLADVPDPDLARYLVLAHHGKLRIQVRDPGDLAVLAPAEASEIKLLGLSQGKPVEIPALLGREPAVLTEDLEQFMLGGERSWTRTALDLLDRYGPFVLAYLETVVRIADWRASAGEKLANTQEAATQ